MTPDPKEVANENLINKFNAFIEKWTGNSYPHLIDNDDNDGEDFRDEIESALTAAYQKGVEDSAKICDEGKETFREDTKEGFWGRMGCVYCASSIRQKGHGK